MRYPKPKKNSIYLKAISFFLFSFFLISVQAQNDAVLIIKGQTLTNSGKSGLAGNIGMRSVKTNEDPVVGVDIEVKKNDVTITKITSAKKGKYSFQIPVSTTDSKNDYTIYVSMEGMVPQIIVVNAYLSKQEFAKYSFTKYDFDLDLTMLKTTVKNIVLDKPTAKIKWDNVREHKFTYDQAYARTVQRDEQKMAANPDVYFKGLDRKKKKAEALEAKKDAAAASKLKADEEAKKKADEEAAQKLAALKAKEEADRIQREKEDELKKEALQKHVADSLAEVERKKSLEASSAKVEIKKTATPVAEVEDESKNQYDASGTYSINIAQKTLSEEKARRSREKGKNLTMKYETLNVLTSLLDGVDEYDKKMKRQ